MESQSNIPFDSASHCSREILSEETNDQPLPKRSKPPRAPSKRKQSPAWDHFQPVKENNVVIGAQCNYCPQYYAAGSNSHGTTNMNKHIPKCPKNPLFSDGKGQQTLDLHVKKGGDGVELVSTRYTYEACKQALAEMIIIDELPFRHVEGPGFRRFCNVMQPLFHPIPSRATITREVGRIYNKERELLKQAMKGCRICLTTDTWTSIQNFCYMCLTAHYIDNNWKLQKKILNFCVVNDHKGPTIGRKLEMCLLDWDVDSFFTLTVDNASSNTTTISFLKEATSDWKGTVLRHEFLHMRCCAHILNLVVEEALKEKDSSITAIRCVVRYVRSSPNRLETFKKYCEICKVDSKSGLCLDVSTRWNSTYLMLKAALKFETVFERMKRDDLSFMTYFLEKPEPVAGQKAEVRTTPIKLDWENCRVFVQFLELFYEATLRFSGSLYVTANSAFDEIFIIKAEITRLIKEKDVLLASMAKSMLSKFNKYWGSQDRVNPLLYIAVMLDPRRKETYLNFCLKKMMNNDVLASKIKANAREALTRLFNHYARLDALNVDTPRASEASESGDMDMGLSDPHARLASEFNSFLDTEDLQNEKSELDRYFSDILKVPKKSEGQWDLLEWWKANSSRYKVLSQVARDVLAMPVSTVSSESSFSTGGRIIDPFRSSLSPSTVQKLVCTQNWLRRECIDLRKLMDDVEEFEENTSAAPTASLSESSSCSSPLFEEL